MTNLELQSLKNKYDIIGNDPALNRALEVAVTVAPTDITVLVSGESGVGKENIPRIIHQNSPRKRGKYFAINCGAIPEGTIDSELFGHEKDIVMTGGSSMLRNLDRLISRETGMPVFVSDEALNCVVLGTGIAVENIDIYKKGFMTSK